MAKTDRKLYTKPRLRTIELETKEVMGGTNCKTAGATVALGIPNCGVSAMPEPCGSLGS